MKACKYILLFLYYCMPFAAIFSVVYEKDYGAAVMIVILFAAIYMIRNRKKRRSSALPGIEYENRCAQYLAKKGYKKVQTTPASGDYGADVIAYDRKGKKWVFQCKRYSGSVGNSAVQEVVAAKAHYKADRAAVITNSKMTTNARNLAAENEVELWEELDL